MGLYESDVGTVANKAVVASARTQAPEPKGDANGKPSIGQQGAPPAPKSVAPDQAQAESGGSLSTTARTKVVGNAKMAVGMMYTSYQLAITQLKVGELLKKDEEVGLFTSMLLGVVFGNLTACVLGAAKLLTTVQGAKKALEELGEKSDSALVKSITTDVSEKSLDNTIGVALDIGKEKAKGALKPAEQTEAKEDPNVGAGDEKTQAGKYLTALETAASANFYSLGTSVDGLDDANLLVFSEAVLPKLHTVEIYKDQIKRQLDEYIGSNASKIGRYDANGGPRGSLEEMRVAWINLQSGKRLVYVTRDFDRNDVDTAGVKGNKLYEGEEAQSYSANGAVKSHYKLDRFDGFVEPSLVATALERHRATWKDEPKEYPAEMLPLLTGINAGTGENPVHVSGFNPPEGDDKKYGWY